MKATRNDGGRRLGCESRRVGWKSARHRQFAKALFFRHRPSGKGAMRCLCVRRDVYFAVIKAQNKSLRSCLSAGYSNWHFSLAPPVKKMRVPLLRERAACRRANNFLRLERHILMFCCGLQMSDERKNWLFDTTKILVCVVSCHKLNSTKLYCCFH